MAWELSITSAPRGLKPGRAGFCPVAHTRNMPPLLIERLETISGYRHVEIGAGPSPRNPVVWSHTILRLSRETYHVLSRICDAGRDYSGRSNRFAYHLVLKPEELVPAGPAALLQTPGLMREQWDGQVCVIPNEKAIPKLASQPKPCANWERVLGDAGWAGVLVQRFLNDSQKNIYFVYPAEIDILKLFEEAIALLPMSLRWKVTFSTFDQGLPEVVLCRWRAIPEHAPEAAEILKKRGLEVWDLRTRRGPAPSLPEAAAAREGRSIELPAPQKVVVPVQDVPSSPMAVSPVGSPVAAPSGTKHDVPYLQLAEDPDRPPPLWVASQTKVPGRKRRDIRGLIINLAMLLVGLLVGLSAGFVLWSGLIMPPFFPVVTSGRDQTQQRAREQGPAVPASVKAGHPEDKKPAPPQDQSQQESQPRKEHGDTNAEASRQISPGKSADQNKPTESDEGNSGTPKGDKTSTSEAVPNEAPPDASKNAAKDAEAQAVNPDASKDVVAAPLSELPISQIAEFELAKPEHIHLPGGQTVTSWNERPIWDIKQREIKAEFMILRILDRNGQAKYYVRRAQPNPTVEIRLGQSRQVEIPPIPGVSVELRCDGRWSKTSTDEYRLRITNRELVELKIEQRPANLQVTTQLLKTQNADGQLPSNIPAEVGFHFFDQTTRTTVWVPIVHLKIMAGQAEKSDSGKQSQDGGAL